MSHETPKLTVCLPVYNAMPHLSDTLASILNQTVRDFHILLIDDGSTDDSFAYLQSLDDPRITLIQQQNQGLTATLNRMLEMVGSGWMIRQDADDIALPNRLERIQEYIQRFPNAGMIYSYAGHYQQGGLRGDLLTTATDQTGLRSFLKKGYLPSICHPSIALRVDAALAMGGYRFDLHVEDYDLYWRVGLRYDVHMIPEVLLGYRMTSSSVSDQNSRKQATNILYVQYLLLSELWKKRSSTYGEVEPVLQRMVDQRHLNFRKHMRTAMGQFGERRYRSFAFEIAKAFAASPQSFMTRLLRQESEGARIGISPEIFRAQTALLWPSS
jgi:glycosyltransferase involved in cell wall biosynthesis